jgi:exopolyphosphatase/guanosine-5'-triphosphate,3'-diphosphate pyrophosphatase
MKMPLRLSEHLQADGTVDAAAVTQLVEFAEAGMKLAEDKGATEIMAFATSAIREAANGEDVLRRLKESGLDVQVLSGEDEARMTFLAARRWFGWSSGRILLLDIGGGSLEIATGTDEEPDAAMSVPLGAGRLTRDFLVGDPPTPESVRELRRYARARIAEVAGRVRRHGEPRVAVATSKTFKQLARIAGAAPSSDGMHVRRVLRADDVRGIVARLADMTVAERSRIPGVSEGRSEQMIAGAVVAEAAMDLFEIEELVICPWALREGLILHRLDGLPL